MAQQGWETSGRDERPRDPAVLREVLSDARFAPLWLLPRLAVGWLWLEVGWSDGSTPLRGFAANGGHGLDTLQALALTLLGIALLLGGLTGVAAFAGGCLSAGLWAGESVTFAALHFAAVISLILAWKTAGWIGLDRWLLPALGLPWRGGTLFTGNGARMNLERRMQGESNDAR